MFVELAAAACGSVCYYNMKNNLLTSKILFTADSEEIQARKMGSMVVSCLYSEFLFDQFYAAQFL